MKVFILSTYLTTSNTGELVVNGTVDCKDNEEEKSREVADIKMVVDMKVFILSTYLTTLDTGELEVNDTVDSKDNLEEKTREVDGK